MKFVKHCLFFLVLFSAIYCSAQTFTISGKVTAEEETDPIPQASVGLKDTERFTYTDNEGMYELKNVPPGTYQLIVTSYGYISHTREIIVSKDLSINVELSEEVVELKDTVVIHRKRETFGITRLGDVEGTAIYAGKKTEVVVMKDITANTATNNSRQIYAKVSGLNIWESDGAGIQLGIGGRGLNPNRVSNFNTRQNGYDISADALGYPESYYSPPTEALDRIEIVRGAASLQYGTQFGGLVNFQLKKGPEDKKIELTSRQSYGSFKFFNTFNSVGGTVGKVNYYGYIQHKSGNGWRPNSEFNVNSAYTSVSWKASEKFTATIQYTFMDYLAHQPGGLTDKIYNQNPRQSVRARNWFHVNWNLGAVLLDYKINENLKLNSRFFGLIANRSAIGLLSNIIQVDDGVSPRDLLSDIYKNYCNETRLLFHYNNKKNPSTLVVGFRYYSGFTDRKQGLGNNGTGGTSDDFRFTNPDDLEYSKYTFPNHNIALFAENIFQITSKFSIIPGVRFEHIVTRANGFYNDVKKNMAGTIVYSQRIDEHRISDRSFLIGGIGLTYHKSNNLQFYANISQNYRAINFNDMRVVNANLQVDPNLQDETGYTADGGMRGNITSVFSYDLSLFMLNYNNKIGNVNLPGSDTRLRSNISHARNIGFESFAELDIWKLLKGDQADMKLSVFSNLSLIHAKYFKSKEPAYEGNKVEFAPNIILKTGVSLKKNKVTATYQFSYTGKQFTDATNAIYTSNAVNGIIPSYYIMDFSAGYQLNKIFSFYGTVNNLTNNYYFTRRADSYPGPGIIPSDGRSFFLTVQVKL